MSDLFKTRKKSEETIDWRGEITVDIFGETMDLCVRQLSDIEFWEVMSLVDTDEIEALQDELPDDKMEEIADLREKDELTDDEQQRLSELQAEIENEDVDMFDLLSLETFKGIRQAAIYGVEPDEEDKREALVQHGDEIEEKYGGTSSEEAAEYVNDHMIKPMIEDATDFASFSIGIKCLTETIGDTENLGN